MDETCEMLIRSIKCTDPYTNLKRACEKIRENLETFELLENYDIMKNNIRSLRLTGGDYASEQERLNAEYKRLRLIPELAEYFRLYDKISEYIDGVVITVWDCLENDISIIDPSIPLG